VVTDAAPLDPGVIEELPPAAWHHVEQYANNPSTLITAGTSTGSDRSYGSAACSSAFTLVAAYSPE
jgi:hypothetical protein